MDAKMKIRHGIIQTLKKRGGRITHQRLSIIDVLLESEVPQTAIQLLEQVEKNDSCIGLDTVYRNLKTLVNLGIINQIGDNGKKGSRFELADGHHHHIVCTQCGHMERLFYCPMNEERMTSEINRTGFILGTHRMELFGLCPECQEKTSF
jgi:Fe2+/Zn2+ uptake regulation proteins